MIKIVQITTDSREHFKDYQTVRPYFGTAPEGLLSGFSGMPGVEVHVVCCVRKPVASPEKIADNIFYHSLVVPPLGWGRSLFLGCAYSVRKLLDKIQPDIVHGQGTERDCALAAVLSGYPNVITIHGNMRVHAARKEQQRSLYYWMIAMLEGWCARRTDGIVAISNFTRKLVEQQASKSWLLPNAVDTRYFAVAPIPADIPRVLFVGALAEWKNPQGLLEACEPLLRAGECTLAFAGSGADNAYTASFLKMVKTIPGVEILGFINQEQLAHELAGSSLLVLPTFEDNCPMVILEAMAAGVPVAASTVGGIPDLIEHEVTGLLFDPHQSMGIRTSVERLVRDSELRNKIAARARTEAQKRFHPKIIASGHLEIYQEVLASR